jgi:hypothetical protein
MLNDKSYGKQKIIIQIHQRKDTKCPARSCKISETANAGDGFFRKSKRS